MNRSVSPAVSSARRRVMWLVWVVAALTLLILMMGAPAWAATGPADWQQGTVPMPPPAGGGGSGSGNQDDDNSPPSATATPTPAAPAATQAAPVGTPAAESGVVSAPRVNMRSGPGVNFAVVGRVVQDQVLTIQFRDVTGEWWYTCCSTGTAASGWVSVAFVRPTSFDLADAATVLPVAGAIPLATTATPTPQGGASVGDTANLTGTLGTVTVARLNLRAEPSADGAILGKMNLNQTVQILDQSADGAWLNVCCLEGTTTEGWVSATFVRAAASTAPTGGVLLPTPTPRPGATLAATQPLTTALQMVIVQEPPFVAPGDLLLLRYTITNTGAAPAVALELRNELTPTLALAGGEAGGDGLLQQSKTDSGHTVLSVTWPELDAGAAVSATVALTVAADLPLGSLVDNIAAVAAQNAPAQTAGVRIGMPPAVLPDFQ